MKPALLILVWIIALFGIISLADSITQWGADWVSLEVAPLIVAHKVITSCGI